jgi:hypothetical protein
MVQDAVSTKSTVAYSADEDKIYGSPIMVVLKHKAVADQAYDSAAAIVNVAGSKPVLSQKYRIVQIKTVMRSLRTGGAPDHDFKLELGDGAASESFNSVVASVDTDGDTQDTDVVRIIVPAYAVWTTGCTLRSQLAVSGSTTTGTTEWDVFLTLLPTN